MNKKLYILMIAIMAHSVVFCMDDAHEVARQKWILMQFLNQLGTAIIKARYYPQVQEYQQNVEVKHHDLKERFPQDVELLPDGKICCQYISIDGRFESLIM